MLLFFCSEKSNLFSKEVEQRRKIFQTLEFRCVCVWEPSKTSGKKKKGKNFRSIIFFSFLLLTGPFLPSFPPHYRIVQFEKFFVHKSQERLFSCSAVRFFSVVWTMRIRSWVITMRKRHLAAFQMKILHRGLDKCFAPKKQSRNAFWGNLFSFGEKKLFRHRPNYTNTSIRKLWASLLTI